MSVNPEKPIALVHFLFPSEPLLTYNWGREEGNKNIPFGEPFKTLKYSSTIIP